MSNDLSGAIPLQPAAQGPVAWLAARLGLEPGRWDTGWDIAARVLNVLWAGWVLLGQGLGFMTIIQNRADMTTPVLVTALASRLASVMFLSLFVVAVISRIRPIAKAEGLWPRVVALGGTFLPTAIFLLPRTDDIVVINVLSAALCALGYGLAIYALSHLNRSMSIMPEARILVTSGPYRAIRHPVYAFEQIGVIGMVLPFAPLWAAPLFVVQLWCQLQRMKNEERVLAHAFPEYADYARRTARLVPGVY